MSNPEERGRRTAYVHFRDITTRWMDNDVYRHVNNVTYYSFFDTGVNQLAIEAGELDISSSPIIALVRKETPRLCRGGSRSLTNPGVHP